MQKRVFFLLVLSLVSKTFGLSQEDAVAWLIGAGTQQVASLFVNQAIDGPQKVPIIQPVAGESADMFFMIKEAFKNSIKDYLNDQKNIQEIVQDVRENNWGINNPLYIYEQGTTSGCGLHFEHCASHADMVLPANRVVTHEMKKILKSSINAAIKKALGFFISVAHPNLSTSDINTILTSYESGYKIESFVSFGLEHLKQIINAAPMSFRSDTDYPILTTHSTALYCGPQNPYCLSKKETEYDKTNQFSVIFRSFLDDITNFTIKSGELGIGVILSYISVKAGWAITSALITVPKAFTAQTILLETIRKAIFVGTNRFFAHTTESLYEIVEDLLAKEAHDVEKDLKTGDLAKARKEGVRLQNILTRNLPKQVEFAHKLGF